MNPTTNPYGAVGTLTRSSDQNVIRFDRVFDAPADRVWDALTTNEGLMSWLAPKAAIEASLGGRVMLEFDEENLVTGTITKWNPRTSFSHEWTINGEHDSIVSYELTPTESGTNLTLIHTGLPDEMCGGYTPGWHAYLARLDAIARDAEPPAWLDVFQAVAGSYA